MPVEKLRLMDSTKHRFFAPCPRGLEQVLDQELRRYTQDAGNHVALELHPAATLSLR